VERGCREVVLTGVQIGAYGRDRYVQRGQDLPPPGVPLAGLVRAILEQTTVSRIRISSIQPQDWPEDFLDLFDDPRLCRHLHLPLQAGCDETLRRMARRYATGDFAALVERIRSRMPDAAITADVIVGFPGETDSDHQVSRDFVREMAFTDAHVFRYSPRRGTAASRMAGQVTPDVKQARSAEMRVVSDASARRFRERFVGRSAEVLWEEELNADQTSHEQRRTVTLDSGAERPTPDSRRWTGLTGNYLRVNLDSAADLLGASTLVRLSNLDGEVFRGVATPHGGE
jgi:threonylcarbamoyladenosine tRNA methylthiotransferase MtaB